MKAQELEAKEMRLVDAGQSNVSLWDKWYSKFTKAYLVFTDARIQRYVRKRAPESIAKDYPALQAITENWETIKADAENLISDIDSIVYYEDVDKRYARKNGNTKTKKKEAWQIEQFVLYGSPINRGFERAPKTAQLLADVPGVQTALFSVLNPGAHIRTHCGEYAGLLRYHLGLVVEKPDQCKLRVEDEIFNWAEGEAFIWDHTHEHEAWNESDKIRIILIVDFVRKLPLHLNVLNRCALMFLRRSGHIKQAIATLEHGREKVPA